MAKTIGWLVWILALLGLVITAMIILPNFATPRSIIANEAAAVGSIRSINAAQLSYAAAHKSQSFACDLRTLGGQFPCAPGKDPACLIDERLASGERGGYRFVISGCATDAAGKVVSYQATGSPAKPRVSGNRYFCSNESQAIWFDTDSAETCLRKRKLLR